MIKKIEFYLHQIKTGALQRFGIRLKWIYQYAKQYWMAMIFYTVLGLSSVLTGLISAYVSKNLIDVVTGTERELSKLIFNFVLMMIINMGTSVIVMVSSYVSSKISMKVDADIKADIFEKILVTDWESLATYHTGDLLTRWGSDVSVISQGVLNFIPNMIIYVCKFISALVVMIYYDYTFALIALAGMPFSILLSRRLMQKMARTNMSSAKMNAKVSGFNQETFANIQTIKAFDMVRLYSERLKQLQSEFISMKLSFQKISIGLNILVTLLGMVISNISYGWGIFRVWSGAISYGTMTMFLSLSTTLSGTINNIVSLFPTAVGLTVSAGRLMDIVEMPREDYTKRNEFRIFHEKHVEEGVGLSLKNVTYGYKNSTDVFEDINFEAHPHEVIGLVGPSGEGKTTMLRILLSLVLPKEGEADIVSGNEKMPLNASARQLMSYVPQGNTMFSGTIEENMKNVKPDATEEEIIHALKLACAWDFVEKLPKGIKSEIKERGGGFSEGQAQRLSIARAIIRKSPILLLDEASSALDVATERKMLKNIMTDDYPRTCIVTTHRPTVLDNCHRVYKLSDKKCNEISREEIKELIDNF